MSIPVARPVLDWMRPMLAIPKPVGLRLSNGLPSLDYRLDEMENLILKQKQASELISRRLLGNPVGYLSAERLSEQTENALRALVGDSENRSTGLNKDLSPSQTCSFLREVRISDRALGLGQVGERIAQGDRVAFQSRSLERTESTSKACNLFDNFVDDLRGTGRVGLQVERFTATELV